MATLTHKMTSFIDCNTYFSFSEWRLILSKKAEKMPKRFYFWSANLFDDIRIEIIRLVCKDERASKVRIIQIVTFLRNENSASNNSD